MRRATGIAVLAVLAGWVSAHAATVPAGVAIHANKTVSVSLEAADLRAVVTALARTFDINVVGSNKLTGTVTLHLQKVAADQALEVILRNAGFELVRKNERILEILTPAEAATARAATQVPVLQVFTLKFAEVDRVAKLLVPNAIPAESMIAQDAASNQLIIKATKEQLEATEEVIRAVDVPLPQVKIEARIVEINTDKARSLGAKLRVEGKSNQAGDNGVGSMDVSLLQPMLSLPTFTFKFLSDRVDAQLEMLVRKGVGEVLSAPTLTTGHGRAAEFKVVNQVPYATRTTRIVDNVTVTDETVTFQETGVTLEVTPRVLGDGKVQMVVKPSVLVLTGYTDTDPSAPIIDTRTTKTDVTISDGKWVVIGGLMSSVEQKDVRGIPILKDIPLLGWFFRTTRVTRQKTNLVILLTAQVLDDERSDAITDAANGLIRRHRDKHGLVGSDFDADEEDDPARRAGKKEPARTDRK